MHCRQDKCQLQKLRETHRRSLSRCCRVLLGGVLTQRLEGGIGVRPRSGHGIQLQEKPSLA